MGLAASWQPPSRPRARSDRLPPSSPMPRIFTGEVAIVGLDSFQQQLPDLFYFGSGR
uniref:Uncharacterized protein n=1 Tax=Arundo donax TaxID=35708 RepID=A0A0A9GJC4_ARUDO